jgi:antitoxin FitA
MTTLTLKNFPEDVYAQLKARAAENRRSLNAEAILCLESVLARRPSPADVNATLDALRRARSKVRRAFLTDRDLRRDRTSGRA